jgi:CheY-like chemotaxis protein
MKTSAHWARKKILLVEDNALNRDLLVQLLDGQFEVIIAVDGAEGVKKAEEEKPDLVLMDLALPVLDGWEATRRIKANSALKKIPIIAVTSHAMIGEAKKAYEAGCDDYLAKPVNEVELMAKIRKFLTD